MKSFAFKIKIFSIKICETTTLLKTIKHALSMLFGLRRPCWISKSGDFQINYTTHWPAISTLKLPRVGHKQIWATYLESTRASRRVCGFCKTVYHNIIYYKPTFSPHKPGLSLMLSKFSNECESNKFDFLFVIPAILKNFPGNTL